MWELQNEWYELVIRAFCVFSFLFIVMRIWGKKHFGEFTPFDFILLLIMSEAVQNALVDDEKSVSGALITISTMILMNICLNKITFYSRRAEEVLDGTPKFIIKNGKIDHQVMKEQTITDMELHEALRMQGVLHISDVALATLETNGSISVVKKKENGSIVDKLFQ